MQTYTKFIAALPTATVLMGGMIVNGNELANVNYSSMDTTYTEQESSVLSDISQTHFTTITSSSTTFDEFEIIQKFGSNLLENIEDLDPEFSQAIDENYWDLI